MDYRKTPEENEALAKAVAPLEDEIVGILRSANLGLDYAKYLLGRIEDRISKEAKI